ncbi:MAG: hypothetical protein LBB88_05510 [Planctomycetaceae bacterium]|jgi:hypothetical protein|nr:hypothetical protein [Planctomycetaceae bacterium]
MKNSINMKKKYTIYTTLVSLAFLLSTFSIFSTLLSAESQNYILENNSLKRVLSVTADQILQTSEITNKRNNVTVKPASAREFQIRLSKGTDKPETQFTLNSADFAVKNTQQNKTKDKKTLTFNLEGKKYPITISVEYSLNDNEFFMRKILRILSKDDFILERIDVETLRLEDAYQPYTLREITANANARWSPGLGQPLYESKAAMFWGIEFPAADNRVANDELIAGYLYGKKLAKETTYVSYPAVMGAADDPNFIRESLFEYIELVRKRPLRLQVQYNSWFDLGGRGVNRNTIANSVSKIHQELVKARGCRPLNAYVIDDGWQDTGADWSDKVWKVNTQRFDADFAETVSLMKEIDSNLGLWMSPGCLFGAEGAAKKMKNQGYEMLDPWASMAGPKYMQAFEDRTVELTRQGVSFFKLDGIFGHLNVRNFELHGGRYGLPEMPQLELDGFASNDKRLNDSKYDELKIYYLSAGTERLIQAFDNVAKINPDIYFVISNGAWLSPWWLVHIDSVWMINADDAAGGSLRNAELTYRDGCYYEFWTTQHAQFPLYAIFNHEPKKLNSKEPKDVFRKYLYMNLSRGTGFVEMYIKPKELSDYDWDVLAEGLQWTYEMFPTFNRVLMHGGNPRKNEVYGFTAWNNDIGYISLHNPADKPSQYSVYLNREFGLPAETAKDKTNKFYINSPLEDSVKDLPETIQVGDKLTFQLQPKEIRIVCFSKTQNNWQNLKSLQKRTSNDFQPPPPTTTPTTTK